MGVSIKTPCFFLTMIAPKFSVRGRRGQYRDDLNILWQGTRWCVFRSMAQCFVTCIQSIGSFVRAATGVVTTWRDLLARIGFCVRQVFVGIRYPFRLDTCPDRDSSYPREASARLTASSNCCSSHEEVPRSPACSKTRGNGI